MKNRKRLPANAREKGEGRREKREGRREKREGRREKGQERREREGGKREKGEERREEGQETREKGEGRRKKREGRRDKGEGRREKGEGRREGEGRWEEGEKGEGAEGSYSISRMEKLSCDRDIILRSHFTNIMEYCIMICKFHVLNFHIYHIIVPHIGSCNLTLNICKSENIKILHHIKLYPTFK
jgi:hypothetical protein